MREGGRPSRGKSEREQVAKRRRRRKFFGGKRENPRRGSWNFGFISAGLFALRREGFGGALRAGHFLELTRAGDGEGGPWAPVLVARVVEDEDDEEIDHGPC